MLEEPEIYESDAEQLPTPSQDLTQGYCIKVDVRPDGFTVSEPLPIDSPSDAEYAESELSDPIPDQLTMVKHLLAVIKANPLGEDAVKQMEAGFQSR